MITSDEMAKKRNYKNGPYAVASGIFVFLKIVPVLFTNSYDTLWILRYLSNTKEVALCAHRAATPQFWLLSSDRYSDSISNVSSKDLNTLFAIHATSEA